MIIHEEKKESSIGSLWKSIKAQKETNLSRSLNVIGQLGGGEKRIATLTKRKFPSFLTDY